MRTPLSAPSLQERLLLSDSFSPPYDYPRLPHPKVRSGALRHANAASLDRFLVSRPG